MPLTKTMPGLDLVDEARPLGRVVGPDAGAQAERRVVGQRDRLVEVLDAEQRGHRAEDLLAVGGRARRDVGQHGGRVEVARAGPGACRRSAACAPAATERSHLLVERRRASARVASGPTSVAASSGSPTFSASMRLDEAPLELVVDRLVHDEALGGDAGLAVVDDARLHRRRRRPRRGRRWASR